MAYLAKKNLLSTPGLSARDAVHADVMINRGVTAIAAFDRIEEITRFELAQPRWTASSSS